MVGGVAGFPMGNGRAGQGAQTPCGDLLRGLSQHDAVRCPQPSEIPCRLDNAKTFLFKMQGSFLGLKE